MTMELKPIKTKRDYQTALRRAQQLWDAPTGSADADALDILTLLIADCLKDSVCPPTSSCSVTRYGTLHSERHGHACPQRAAGRA